MAGEGCLSRINCFLSTVLPIFVLVYLALVDLSIRSDSESAKVSLCVYLTVIGYLLCHGLITWLFSSKQRVRDRWLTAALISCLLLVMFLATVSSYFRGRATVREYFGVNRLKLRLCSLERNFGVEEGRWIPGVEGKNAVVSSVTEEGFPEEIDSPFTARLKKLTDRGPVRPKPTTSPMASSVPQGSMAFDDAEKESVSPVSEPQSPSPRKRLSSAEAQALRLTQQWNDRRSRWPNHISKSPDSCNVLLTVEYRQPGPMAGSWKNGIHFHHAWLEPRESWENSRSQRKGVHAGGYNGDAHPPSENALYLNASHRRKDNSKKTKDTFTDGRFKTSATEIVFPDLRTTTSSEDTVSLHDITKFIITRHQSTGLLMLLNGLCMQILLLWLVFRLYRCKREDGSLEKVFARKLLSSQKCMLYATIWTGLQGLGAVFFLWGLGSMTIEGEGFSVMVTCEAGDGGCGGEHPVAPGLDAVREGIVSTGDGKEPGGGLEGGGVAVDPEFLEQNPYPTSSDDATPGSPHPVSRRRRSSSISDEGSPRDIGEEDRSDAQSPQKRANSWSAGDRSEIDNERPLTRLTGSIGQQSPRKTMGNRTRLSPGVPNLEINPPGGTTAEDGGAVQPPRPPPILIKQQSSSFDERESVKSEDLNSPKRSPRANAMNNSLNPPLTRTLVKLEEFNWSQSDDSPLGELKQSVRLLSIFHGLNALVLIIILSVQQACRRRAMRKTIENQQNDAFGIGGERKFSTTTSFSRMTSFHDARASGLLEEGGRTNSIGEGGGGLGGLSTRSQNSSKLAHHQRQLLFRVLSEGMQSRGGPLRASGGPSGSVVSHQHKPFVGLGLGKINEEAPSITEGGGPHRSDSSSVDGGGGVGVCGGKLNLMGKKSDSGNKLLENYNNNASNIEASNKSHKKKGIGLLVVSFSLLFIGFGLTIAASISRLSSLSSGLRLFPPSDSYVFDLISLREFEKIFRLDVDAPCACDLFGILSIVGLVLLHVWAALLLFLNREDVIGFQNSADFDEVAPKIGYSADEYLIHRAFGGGRVSEGHESDLTSLESASVISGDSQHPHSHRSSVISKPRSSVSERAHLDRDHSPRGSSAPRASSVPRDSSVLRGSIPTQSRHQGPSYGGRSSTDNLNLRSSGGYDRSSVPSGSLSSGVSSQEKPSTSVSSQSQSVAASDVGSSRRETETRVRSRAANENRVDRNSSRFLGQSSSSRDTRSALERATALMRSTFNTASGAFDARFGFPGSGDGANLSTNRSLDGANLSLRSVDASLMSYFGTDSDSYSNRPTSDGGGSIGHERHIESLRGSGVVGRRGGGSGNRAPVAWDNPFISGVGNGGNGGQRQSSARGGGHQQQQQDTAYFPDDDPLLNSARGSVASVAPGALPDEDYYTDASA